MPSQLASKRTELAGAVDGGETEGPLLEILEGAGLRFNLAQILGVRATMQFPAITFEVTIFPAVKALAIGRCCSRCILG